MLQDDKGVYLSPWDQRFLGLASHIALWSKDPSTQVGAVLADRNNRVISLGFNGFPRGVADDDRLHNREQKYEMVVHAEINAILFAQGSLEDATLYVSPMPPCSRCASVIIQTGIKRVVAPHPGKRWVDSCLLGLALLTEGGVESIWVDTLK